MPERRDRKPAASSPPTSSLAASREDSHGPGARPERDPPLDRGAADAGQRGRFLGEWVDVGGVIDVESAAREETLDAPVDGGEQPRHLLVGGSAAWNSRLPSSPSAKTPSKRRVWKWTFSWRPPPKRWITVTAPIRPSRTPVRAARRRSNPSTARTAT